GRDGRRSDGRFVDTDVSPDCRQFRGCTPADYSPGPKPSDTGSTHTRISDSQASFSAAGGQTVQVQLRNRSALVTTDYQAVSQAQVTCIRPGQDRPVFVRAEGFGLEIEVFRDCSTRDRRI